MVWLSTRFGDLVSFFIALDAHMGGAIYEVKMDIGGREEVEEFEVDAKGSHLI